MGSTGYEVTAAAVRIVVGPTAHLVERGRLLPAGVAVADIARMLTKGMIAPVAEPEPDAAATGVDFDPKKANVAELRDFAAAHGIDLGDSTKKADIVSVIEAALASSDGSQDSGVAGDA